MSCVAQQRTVSWLLPLYCVDTWRKALGGARRNRDVGCLVAVSCDVGACPLLGWGRHGGSEGWAQVAVCSAQPVASLVIITNCVASHCPPFVVVLPLPLTLPIHCNSPWLKLTRWQEHHPAGCSLTYSPAVACSLLLPPPKNDTSTHTNIHRARTPSWSQTLASWTSSRSASEGWAIWQRLAQQRASAGQRQRTRAPRRSVDSPRQPRRSGGELRPEAGPWQQQQ